MNDSHQANYLLEFDNYEDDEVKFPLSLPLVQMDQQKYINQRN